MKRNTQFFMVITLMLLLAGLPFLSAGAQWVDPPADTSATPVPWNYVPENPAVNPPGWVEENIVQQVTERPMLYVASYDTSGGNKSVNPYGSFGLTFTIGNNGKEHARNIILTFSSQVFDPLDGSVINIWEVDALNAQNETRTHQFKVNDMSTWMYSGIITAAVSYMDPAGNTYSEVFTFTITINQSGTGQVSATPTPAVVDRAQMVVNNYSTDIDPSSRVPLSSLRWMSTMLAAPWLAMSHWFMAVPALLPIPKAPPRLAVSAAVLVMSLFLHR